MAKIRNVDNPTDWHGTRKPRLMADRCGWCMDSDFFKEPAYCQKCVHEIGYFDSLYVCPCECNASWVPHAVVVEKGGAVVGSASEPLPRPVVAEPEPRPKRTPKPTVPTESPTVSDE